MKSSEDMIRLNQKQAVFYNDIYDAEADEGHGGYAENKSANWLTRFWADLRYRQQAAVKQAGIEKQTADFHERWAIAKQGGDFFELGCFSGSRFTFRLAELSGAYLGVELSPKAVEALNSRFRKRNLSRKAKAEARDFLTLDTNRKFDLLYAHGVLHHFENPVPLFEKLAAICKPKATLVFCEPSAVNLVYHSLRSVYRPFQSDAAWEWPFTKNTVANLERRFTPVDGFGWGRWSLPLSVMIGLPVVGNLVLPLYFRFIRNEVQQGWHQNVWRNSYVTAAYQFKG